MLNLSFMDDGTYVNFNDLHLIRSSYTHPYRIEQFQNLLDDPELFWKEVGLLGSNLKVSNHELELLRKNHKEMKRIWESAINDKDEEIERLKRNSGYKDDTIEAYEKVVEAYEQMVKTANVKSKK